MSLIIFSDDELSNEPMSDETRQLMEELNENPIAG